MYDSERSEEPLRPVAIALSAHTPVVIVTRSDESLRPLTIPLSANTRVVTLTAPLSF